MHATTAETAYHQALQAYFEATETYFACRHMELVVEAAMQRWEAARRRVFEARDALTAEYRDLLISLGILPHA